MPHWAFRFVDIVLELGAYALLYNTASRLRNSIQTTLDGQPDGPDLVTAPELLKEYCISLLPSLAMLGPQIAVCIGLKRRCIYTEVDPGPFWGLMKALAIVLSVGTVLLIGPCSWILGIVFECSSLSLLTASYTLLVLVEVGWNLSGPREPKIPTWQSFMAVMMMFVNAVKLEYLAGAALEASTAGDHIVTGAALYCIATCLVRIYALSDLCPAKTLGTVCDLADLLASCGLASVAIYKLSSFLSGSAVPSVVGIEDVFLHSIGLLAVSRHRRLTGSGSPDREKAE